MTRDHLVEAMAKALKEKMIYFGRRDPRDAEVGIMAAEALSALESLGIALVPVEPTEEMIRKGGSDTDVGELRAWQAYRAFLSASPLRKTEGGEE